MNEERRLEAAMWPSAWIANGMIYTSQGREESVEAPELRTTKEQNQIGGYSLTQQSVLTG